MAVDRDLESFARLQAALRRPFTRREDVLRDAGLTEGALQDAQRAWGERLAAEDAGPLRDRYRAAYAGREPAVPEVTTPDDGEAPIEASAPAIMPAPPIRHAVPSYLNAPRDAVELGIARLAHADPDATQPPVGRAGPTLPFVPGASGDVPEAVRAQRGAGQREPRPPAADGDETAFLPVEAFGGSAERAAIGDGRTISLDADAVSAAAAAPEPWISLEEYVRFLAALARNPSGAGALRARFGIATEEAQRALGAGFAARFARDPGERARFDELLAQARGSS